jgi:hypothetical protein
MKVGYTMTLEQIGITIGILMLTTAYTALILLLQYYGKVWLRARRIAKLRRKNEKKGRLH